MAIFSLIAKLGLDGTVRPVKGVLAIAIEAKRRGRQRVIVPEANMAEAAIIDGIHTGELRDAALVRDPIMGLDVVTACTGVPGEMLQPALSWRDRGADEATARELAERFRLNFEKYAGSVDAAVAASGPGGVGTQG